MAGTKISSEHGPPSRGESHGPARPADLFSDHPAADRPAAPAEAPGPAGFAELSALHVRAVFSAVDRAAAPGEAPGQAGFAELSALHVSAVFSAADRAAAPGEAPGQAGFAELSALHVRAVTTAFSSAHRPADAHGGPHDPQLQASAAMPGLSTGTGPCICREPRQTCRSGGSSLPVLVGATKPSLFASSRTPIGAAGVVELHPNI